MSLKVPPDSRLEIKFACYEVHQSLLTGWLEKHWAGFNVPYPDRRINNVYFDTYNYDGFLQNLSGASSRTKVRYRWYGYSPEPSSGTLEVKCKRNYFGWKLRYPCPEFSVDKRDDWLKIRRTLASQLSLEGRIWLDSHPAPIMINRYDRQYFVSADNNVRVTIDTNQAVWDQRSQASPNLDREANMPRTLVVEVKFSREERKLAENMLQGLPIRVSRHSKYINGVRAITGY